MTDVKSTAPTKLLLTSMEIATFNKAKMMSILHEWWGHCGIQCKWNFTPYFPTNIEIVTEYRQEQTQSFWLKRKKTVTTTLYCYYLVFDKVLSEEELKMWRMFKYGFFFGRVKDKYI